MSLRSGAGPGGPRERRSRGVRGATPLELKTTGTTLVGEEVASEPQEVLPAKSGEKPKYGIGNIKNFSFNGPLGLSIGVSRDAAAKKPELTADLSFVDGSWKLTGLVPEL